MVDENIVKAAEALRKTAGKKLKIDKELVGGMMNEAFLVSGKKNRYVLYLPTKQANEMVDRKLEKKTHNLAFKLGITNKTVYFNVKTGIKINEYIKGFSINKHQEEEDFENVAKLLATYHSSKRKSGVYYDPLKRLEAYKTEASQYVDNFSEEFNKLFSIVIENKDFLLSQKITLAHNDAQRSNIVKADKDGKYYLIDYEFAADNDPLYDIATFGNNDVEDGLKLLKEYEKLVHVEDGLKRYALWRIDVSLQWYLVAIIKHYRGEGAIHGFDFLEVANNFMENALKASELLK